jgi:hypothetical protein
MLGHATSQTFSFHIVMGFEAAFSRSCACALQKPKAQG